MKIHGQLDTVIIVKKVSRNNYMNGHRNTLSQIIKDKSKYNRKQKHRIAY